MNIHAGEKNDLNFANSDISVQLYALTTEFLQGYGLKFSKYLEFNLFAK